MKDLMIQMQDDEQGVQLANVLGISYLDLDSLNYEIHTVKSDDGLTYNYYVEFSENSPADILKKIVRLEGRGVYLDTSELETEDYNDDYFYYDEQFDAIISNTNYYDTFLNEISNIRKLSSLQVEDIELKEILYRQIFISVFGTLETFLSDTFINLTMGNDDFLKKFVQTHPEFKQRKFELREVFDAYEKIKDTAKKVMLDTIYHDLRKIKEMYSTTFSIDFPDLTDVIKFVPTRHDLVHRNGKTKEGEKAIIDIAGIDDLINVVSLFVKEIAVKLDLHKTES